MKALNEQYQKLVQETKNKLKGFKDSKGNTFNKPIAIKKKKVKDEIAEILEKTHKTERTSEKRMLELNELKKKKKEIDEKREKENKESLLQREFEEKVNEKLRASIRKYDNTIQEGEEQFLDSFIEYSKLAIKILSEDSLIQEDFDYFPKAIKTYKESRVNTEDVIIKEKVSQLEIMGTNLEGKLQMFKGAILDVSKS